jgi:hypothetical protein
MTLNCDASRRGAKRLCASAYSTFKMRFIRKALAALVFAQGVMLATSAQAGLYKRDGLPLWHFGFSTAGQIQSAPEFIQFFNVTKQVLGPGAIVRTGLGWDPTNQNVPGFADWSATVLEPALARDIIILPGIRTLNLDSGGYRMPTDTQWTNGLRQIVKMYGPNGIYQKGGSYIINGRTVNVAAHPGFNGLVDYELWNEPNTQGNLGGAMTPARITQLLKVGSAAMREEAAKLGFKINVIGPAIGGIDLDYLTKLWNADNNLFNYIDTLTIHAYMRLPPSKCDSSGPTRLRCVETFEKIRNFIDSKGGTHVHLGTTEGGSAGDRGTCTGPQVLSEEKQRDHSVENLLWLRGRPWLKMDFWITSNPIDGTRKYGYACDSGIYDIPYWEDKLGVLRSDLSWKPWGLKLRDLVAVWR